MTGYSTRASKAKGQHTSSSKHHSKNAIIILGSELLYENRSRRFGRKDGAGDGIRTRDINLGKVALYQLSYSRAWEEISLSLLKRGAVNPSQRSHLQCFCKCNKELPVTFYTYSVLWNVHKLKKI